MPDTKTIDPLLVAQIVRNYVAHNGIPSGELPNLIATVHRSLTELGKPGELPALSPAVAINRSYGSDFVICLDCGWRGQMLRRHLTTAHDLSREDYRIRWNLKDTHPLVAPGYASRRSALAKQLGLGRSPQPASEPEHEAVPLSASPAEAGLDPAFAASFSGPKRRGRPRRVAP